MLESDFKDYKIYNFTKKEVEETGAKLEDVKLALMRSIQKFREYIRRRVILVENGITTGNHKSIMHPDGKAIDGTLYIEDGPINIHILFKGALEAGFKGIGIYWNGIQYSFHFDLRNNYAFWIGIKDSKKGVKKWIWKSLLQDPAKIKLPANLP